MSIKYSNKDNPTEVIFNNEDVKCVKYVDENNNYTTSWSKPIIIVLDSKENCDISMYRYKQNTDGYPLGGSEPTSQDRSNIFSFDSPAGSFSDAFAFDMLSGLIRADNEIGYTYSNPSVEYRLYKDSTPLTDYKKIGVTFNDSYAYFANSGEYDYNKIGFKATFDREYDTKQINLVLNPNISSEYIDSMYFRVVEKRPDGTSTTNIYNQNTTITVNYGNKYEIYGHLHIKFPSFTFRDPEAGEPPNPNLIIDYKPDYNTSASTSLNSIMDIYNCNTVTLSSELPFTNRILFEPIIRWVSGDSHDVQYIFTITDNNWRLLEAQDYGYTPMNTSNNNIFVFYSNLKNPSISTDTNFYFWCSTSLNIATKLIKE